MKVLVTGATGFLGQYLCQKLNANGALVTALGRNEEIGNKLINQGIYFKKVALEDKVELFAACQDQEFVFHCGALSAPWGKKSAFYQANVLGTQHIIDACFRSRVYKLIYVSSPSIYFDFTAKEYIKEDDIIPKGSPNFYIESKKIAEDLIDTAYHEGLPVITLRPRALFGPHDNTILPRIMKTIKNNQFPLINHGKAILDMTYIENVVDALILAMEASKKHNGKKYNITNDEPIELRTFILTLFQEMGLNITFKQVPYRLAMGYATLLEFMKSFSKLNSNEPELTRYGVGVLGLTQTLNIDAAKRDLKYNPKISISDGIQRLARWWKENER